MEDAPLLLDPALLECLPLDLSLLELLPPDFSLLELFSLLDFSLLSRLDLSPRDLSLLDVSLLSLLDLPLLSLLDLPEFFSPLDLSLPEVAVDDWLLPSIGVVPELLEHAVPAAIRLARRNAIHSARIS